MVEVLDVCAGSVQVGRDQSIDARNVAVALL